MHSGLSVSLAIGEAEQRGMEAAHTNGLAWAVSRWNDEVSQRPLANVHRRGLDDTWRQVIRYFGGDPDALLGPDHDALLARTTGVTGRQPGDPKSERDLAMAQHGWQRECDAADELLRLMFPTIEPGDFRTDGGWVNMSKVRKLWKRTAGVSELGHHTKT